MDLKEFVTATLRDVLEGIQEAKKLESVGKHVSPTAIGSHEFPRDSGVSNSSRYISTAIKFDVAVTAEQNNDVNGKLGMKVAVMGIGFEAGAGEKQGTRNSAVSRIQFSVPIMMPD